MDAVAANDTAHSVRLTIPARAEFIPLGRLALSGIMGMHAQPLAADLLGDLQLAVTEACTNSVRHAYGAPAVDDPDCSNTVEILYSLYADRLAVEVADGGGGFASGHPPEPADAHTFDDDELSEGGLGLAIIRAIADEVEFSMGADGGFRLRFIKRLD